MRCDEIIVLIIFGILMFLLFDNFKVFILYVIFWRNVGFDMKFKKWFIFIGFSFVFVMVGGLIGCLGFVWKVCFFVLLILNFVNFGMSCKSFVLE